MKREDLILEESTRVALITLDPGDVSPWHYHSSVRETVVCVSGKIMLEVASFVLASGEWREIGLGDKHSLSNPEAVPSIYLLVQRGIYDFVQTNP